MGKLILIRPLPVMGIGRLRMEQNKDSSTGICTTGSYFDSTSNELVRHVGMSDFPCLAIAAVDADKDTDVFTFKSKKYTYSNVDILAILQASPYFGELQDNYYNGNIGEPMENDAYAPMDAIFVLLVTVPCPDSLPYKVSLAIRTG